MRTGSFPPDSNEYEKKNTTLVRKLDIYSDYLFHLYLVSFVCFILGTEIYIIIISQIMNLDLPRNFIISCIFVPFIKSEIFIFTFHTTNLKYIFLLFTILSTECLTSTELNIFSMPAEPIPEVSLTM